MDELRKPFSGESAVSELKDWLAAEKIMDDFPESKWKSEVQNSIVLSKQARALKDMYEEKAEIESAHKKKINWEKTYPERYK